MKRESKPPLREPHLDVIPDSLHLIPDVEGNMTREPVTDLDLAFVIDATGSMSSYINQAKRNIQEITRQISSKAGVNVRLALVEYRDHPPQDSTFTSRQHDFSSSVHDMQKWLDDCSAHGGGDAPEAVADAMNMLLTLTWRPDATKVVVLIADAPPHGLAEYGDTLTDGCPVGHDPIIASHSLAEMSIVLYTVGCEPSINLYTEFFAGLAYLTGGQYVPLGDARLLASVIVGGAEEEISLQQWVPDVDMAVDNLLEDADSLGRMGVVDHDALIADVYTMLKQRGATVKQLQQNNETLTPATNGSKEYAALANMTSARALFAKKSPSHGGVTRGRTMHASRYDEAMPEMAMVGRPEMAMVGPRGRSSAVGIADTAMGRSGLGASHDTARKSSSTSGTGIKSYSAVEAGIDSAQVERLIQRALAKRKKMASEAKVALV